MILQRLRESLYFFWHHLTELLWRLSPLLLLLLLANYRFLVLLGGDMEKARGDGLALLLQLLASVLAGGLAIRFALTVVYGGERTLRRLWGDTVERVLALAAVQILAGLAILGGLFLLVLPGIYLAGVLLPAYVLVMAEDRSAVDALRAAWQRFRGNAWAVAGSVALLVLGLTVVLSGLEALAQLTTPAPAGLRLVLVSVLDLLELLFSQLPAILLVRFYELERSAAGHTAR